jgi:hypothetical protein
MIRRPKWYGLLDVLFYRHATKLLQMDIMYQQHILKNVHTAQNSLYFVASQAFVPDKLLERNDLWRRLIEVAKA